MIFIGHVFMARMEGRGAGWSRLCCGSLVRLLHSSFEVALRGVVKMSQTCILLQHLHESNHPSSHFSVCHSRVDFHIELKTHKQ